MKPVQLFFPILFFLSIANTTTLAQTLYELETIQTIELEFEDSNWESLLDQYYYEDQGQRLLATAVINGIPFDSVGVRYKGNSSYNIEYPKKSLNIKLDYIINQDYEGYTTLKLNNGFKDPSLVREVLGYWLLGHFMEAPQANYARVYINGNYHGLYTNVESINKSFAERHFLSNRNNAFFDCDPGNIVNPPNCPPAPPGASLNYLGEDSICYEPRYIMKSDFGWQDLIQLTYAIDEDPASAPGFMEADRFLWMCTFNNLAVNLDSYLGSITHNYYLFKRDNGRFVPIVWDLNEAFGVFQQLSPGSPLNISQMQSLSPDANKDNPGKPLLNLLLNQTRFRKMYYAHYRAMLENFFSNGTYLAKAEELQTLIAQAVQDDTHALYSYTAFEDNLYQSVFVEGPSGNFISIVGISELMEGRTAFLEDLPEMQVQAPTFSQHEASGISAPGETTTITVQTQHADSVWLLYRYSAIEAFNMLLMYDDGNHQDGSAGDGLFGVSLPTGNTGLQFAFYAENENAGTFLPYNATFGYYELNTNPNIAINELMASNASAQADQDGEYDDWVELYNNTNQIVSLEGFFLSDDESNLQKWTFPAGTQIEAQGYLVVWLDNDEMQQGLHANFRISANGEELFLTAPDGSLVDGVAFGPLPTDFSYARCPNGTGNFTVLAPSFWADNNSACLTNTEEAERESEDWLIYPNPVENQLYWQGPADLSYPVQARLYDARGVLLNIHTLEAPQGQIGLETLPKGLYFLFIERTNKPLRIVK